MQLYISQLITAPFLPTSAEVKQFKFRPGYYRLEMLLRDSSNQYLSTRYNQDGTFADIRYIEVKARAQSGAICLSSSEWKKTQHFDDKFLASYCDRGRKSDVPQLHRIQNPALYFKLDEDIFATGFLIPEDKWRDKKAVG